jgi:hypothetical protein
LKNIGKTKEALCIPAPGAITSNVNISKIFVDNTDQGYTTFNRKKFTYLGSIITNDLEDSAKIGVRIGKANVIL